MWDLFCNDTGNLIIEPKTCDCTEHICWVYTSPRHLFCWAFKTFTVLIFFIRHFVEWKAADSVFNWNTLSVWKLCSLSVQLAVRTIQSFTLFIFFFKIIFIIRCIVQCDNISLRNHYRYICFHLNAVLLVNDVTKIVGFWGQLLFWISPPKVWKAKGTQQFFLQSFLSTGWFKMIEAWSDNLYQRQENTHQNLMNKNDQSQEVAMTWRICVVNMP